jgi:hypothetical protein
LHGHGLGRSSASVYRFRYPHLEKLDISI